MKQDPGPLNCPSCGKELYDNGEERFSCPYCGADVVIPRLTAQETPENVANAWNANWRGKE